MSRSRLAFLAASFVLLGAGCLGGGGEQGDNGGIFLSDDGGANWVQSVALPSASGVGSISAANVLAIEVDPSDSSAIYIGTTGNGMLYSYDNGSSWMRPEEDLARSGAVVDIEVDPRDVCTYYVMKTDRVMKTTTCGRTFMTEAYVQGTDENLTDMVIDWYNPNTLYVSTTGGDLLRTTDGGATWAAITRIKGKISTMTVSNADSRVILFGTKSDGMYRSADGGTTWTEYEKTLKDYRGSDEVYAFAQSADGESLYMASEYGLLMSSDNGATWNDVPLITARGEVQILSLAVDPNDGESVMYGTATTLYRSTSGGTAWTTEELPTSRAATALLIHPDDANRVLMGVRTIED